MRLFVAAILMLFAGCSPRQNKVVAADTGRAATQDQVRITAPSTFPSSPSVVSDSCGTAQGPFPLRVSAIREGENTFAVAMRELPESEPVLNVRVTFNLPGCTQSSLNQEGDVDSADLLFSKYTLVLSDRACALEATGKRWARRSGWQAYGSSEGPQFSAWQLMVEFRMTKPCTPPTSYVPYVVVAEGFHPSMRLVHFERHSEDVDDRGEYAKSSIRKWPKEEQALHARSSGFVALHSLADGAGGTKAREFTWFISSDEDAHKNGATSSRLRDQEGKLLFQLEVHALGPGMMLPEGAIVREGAALYWGNKKIR
jgi:hypothetical protein